MKFVQAQAGVELQRRRNRQRQRQIAEQVADRIGSSALSVAGEQLFNRNALVAGAGAEQQFDAVWTEQRWQPQALHLAQPVIAPGGDQHAGAAAGRLPAPEQGRFFQIVEDEQSPHRAVPRRLHTGDPLFESDTHR